MCAKHQLKSLLIFSLSLAPNINKMLPLCIKYSQTLEEIYLLEAWKTMPKLWHKTHMMQQVKLNVCFSTLHYNDLQVWKHSIVFRDHISFTFVASIFSIYSSTINKLKIMEHFYLIN